MNRPLNLDGNIQEPTVFANNEGGKRKKADEDQWDRTLAKRARVTGKEYKNKAGQVVVQKRRQGFLHCECMCVTQFEQRELRELYNNFWETADHTLQNAYLRGCSSCVGIRTLSNGKERRTFQHQLKFSTRTERVCQKFFLAVHGIKRSRIRAKALEQGVKIDDNRGKHDNHKVKTVEETRDCMRKFFALLPARSSHYSYNKNPKRKYMESCWNIRKLYDEFFKKFDIPREVATLDVFKTIFRDEFNIKFGYPRSDVCETCQRFLTSLETSRLQNADDVIVEEIIAKSDEHQRAAQIFYDDVIAAKEFGEDTFAVCIDYQQNIALPVTKVSREFFLSQLWINNFGIKNLKTDGKTQLFLYSEHFAQKGSNEVISCLLWYIRTCVPATVKTFVIFCDNCGGQNKNREMFSALQNLANERFEEVIIKFAVVGHSRMPIDGSFGRIEKAKRDARGFGSPDEVVSMIKGAQPNKPFDIAYVNNPLTNNMCSDGTPIVIVKEYKKLLEPLFCTHGLGGMSLATLREMKFTRNGPPEVNFTGRYSAPRNLRIFKPLISQAALSNVFKSAVPAYEDFVDVKHDKVVNLQKLLKNVTLKDEVIFYDTIFSLAGKDDRSYVIREK